MLTESFFFAPHCELITFGITGLFQIGKRPIKINKYFFKYQNMQVNHSKDMFLKQCQWVVQRAVDERNK